MSDSSTDCDIYTRCKKKFKVNKKRNRNKAVVSPKPKKKLKTFHYQKELKKLAEIRKSKPGKTPRNRRVTSGKITAAAKQNGIFLKGTRGPIISRPQLNEANQARKEEDLNKIIDIGLGGSPKPRRSRQEKDPVLRYLNLVRRTSSPEPVPTRKIVTRCVSKKLRADAYKNNYSQDEGNQSQAQSIDNEYGCSRPVIQSKETPPSVREEPNASSPEITPLVPPLRIRLHPPSVLPRSHVFSFINTNIKTELEEPQDRHESRSLKSEQESDLESRLELNFGEKLEVAEHRKQTFARSYFPDVFEEAFAEDVQCQTQLSPDHYSLFHSSFRRFQAQLEKYIQKHIFGSYIREAPDQVSRNYLHLVLNKRSNGWRNRCIISSGQQLAPITVSEKVARWQTWDGIPSQEIKYEQNEDQDSVSNSDICTVFRRFIKQEYSSYTAEPDTACQQNIMIDDMPYINTHLPTPPAVFDLFQPDRTSPISLTAMDPYTTPIAVAIGKGMNSTNEVVPVTPENVFELHMKQMNVNIETPVQKYYPRNMF